MAANDTITPANIDQFSGGSSNPIPVPAQPNPASMGGANPPPPIMAAAALPDDPGSHKKLFGMLAGLGVALSSFGKAIATHGREGGAQDVANYQAQQQELALAKQREARAQHAEQRETQEAASRIELQGAQTAAMQVNTQALLAKLPAELQQAHVTLMNSMSEMYQKAGYAPQVALAMAEGQSSQEFMGNVLKNIQGRIGQNSFIPKYDGNYGSGNGTVSIGSRDGLAKVQLDKSALAPSLMNMENMLETAKTAGVDPNLIKQATAQLKRFEAMPQGSKISGAEYQDFVTGFESRIVNGTKAKQDQLAIQTKQQQLSNETQQGKNLVQQGTNLRIEEHQKNLEIQKLQQDISTGDYYAKPDSLGFQPAMPPGGPRTTTQMQQKFIASKEYQNLGIVRGAKQQFDQIIEQMDKGNYSGAASVVGLFDAIGISATPLQGKGMRINQAVIKEHIDARSLGQSLYQKLLKLKEGDVITPQQLKSYAGIGDSAYVSSYVNAINDAHGQGLNADFLLPKGNNQKADNATIQVFLTVSGGDQQRAAQSMTQMGWK